ncbi:hypothetical protein Tco_1211745 [Tanacetum coccineum]
MTSKSNNLELTMVLNSGIALLSTSVMKKGSLKTFPLGVFNTRRQQTEENYHITFDESPDAINFLKPLVDNSNYIKQTAMMFQDTISIPNPPLPIPSVVTPFPQDRWSQDKYIELVNIIRNPGAGMLTRAMAKQLSATSAHECLFVDFLSEKEPKKVFEALKHHGWVDAMQDELKQFTRNKVWILVPEPYGKTIIGSKWVLRAMSSLTMSANWTKPFMDLNKLQEHVKTPMVPPNNLGPDFSGKAVNETQYRGMIGSLIYLTASKPDIEFSTCLCARYQANPKESHLIAVKRIFRNLKGTPSLGLWYPKCSGFDLKGYSDSDYVGCNMDRKSTSGACQLLGGKLVCWSAKKQQSVAMSSAETKYVVATRCCANLLWMKSQLTDYDIIYEKVWLNIDSKIQPEASVLSEKKTEAFSDFSKANKSSCLKVSSVIAYNL